MKIKELNKTQKKKILYSLLGVGTLIVIGIMSWLLWKNGITTENIADRIPTALITYLSLVFLLIKIIWFFVGEYKKTKKRIEEINNFIVEKKEISKEKKIMSRKENNKELKFSWESPNFHFELNNQKEIKIKVKDKVTFASAEDFLNKLTVDNGNFLDKFRKYIHGQL